MAQAPYSVTFVAHVVAIVEPLVENLTLIKDVQQLVINFLGKINKSKIEMNNTNDITEQALHSSDPMSEDLKQSMTSIIRKCK
jgi:hypothetical protein